MKDWGQSQSRSAFGSNSAYVRKVGSGGTNPVSGQAGTVVGFIVVATVNATGHIIT